MAGLHEMMHTYLLLRSVLQRCLSRFVEDSSWLAKSNAFHRDHRFQLRVRGRYSVSMPAEPRLDAELGKGYESGVLEVKGKTAITRWSHETLAN